MLGEVQHVDLVCIVYTAEDHARGHQHYQRDRARSQGVEFVKDNQTDNIFLSW